ncbi:MAG: hypothetical protein ACT4P8_11800 [Betaproteobacteria bacterium]
MRGYAYSAGMLLFALAAGAWAADAERVSIQDINPACRDRHSSVPPEHCVIQDRLPPSQHARRFGGAVVLIEPALSVSSEPRDDQAVVGERRRRPPLQQ